MAATVDPAPQHVPAPGGALVLGVDGTVTTIAPGEVASPAEMTLAHALYDGLTRYEQGQLAPHLAERIESNTESTKYTVSLREGVRFHDGTPLDADAVVRHFERLRAAASACPCAVELAQISSMETPHGASGRTVVFNLTAPNVGFPHLLAGTSGLIESPSAVDLGVNLRSAGVGTGPFVLRNSTPGAKYELEANPDYWDTDEAGTQLPYLDRLTVVALPKQADQLKELDGGSINVLQTTDPATIGEAESLGFAVDKPATPDTTLLLLNNDAEPFDDVRARQALALALDRRQANEPGNDGVRLPADSLFSSESAYYNPRATSPDFDPRGAGELVRELGGLRFTLLCMSDPETNVLMPAIEHMAGAAGMDATLSIVDGDEFSRRVRDLSGDYQAACYRGRPAFEPDAVRPGLASGEGGNLVFYSNRKVDDLLESGRAISDFDARRRTYFEMQELLASDVPLIPVVHLPFAHVYDAARTGAPVVSYPSGAVTAALLHVRVAN